MHARKDEHTHVGEGGWGLTLTLLRITEKSGADLGVLRVGQKGEYILGDTNISIFNI